MINQLQVEPQAAVTEDQFLVNLKAGARGLKRCDLYQPDITHDEEEFYRNMHWSKLLYETGRLGLIWDYGYSHQCIAQIVAAVGS